VGLESIDLRALKQATAMLRAKAQKRFTIEAECFPLQAAAITAPGKYKAFCCSRRAGKSRALAPGLMRAIVTPPYTNVFFLAPTHKRARRILWSALKDINRRYGLGGIANETEALIKFPHLGPDVHLYTAGLKDRGEADKIRGIPGKLWACDELQDCREDVAAYAMREVIQPGILDNFGELWASGTPGAVKAGYFYDITEGHRRHEFEQHHWTWRDNPMLPIRKSGVTNEEIEAKILKEFGLTVTDPTWLREWCGLWHEDIDALVIKPARNCDWQTGPQKGWTYIVGFDIGGNRDTDAIVVLGWQEHSRVVHLVYESVPPNVDASGKKRTVSDLGEDLVRAYETWKPIRVVGDLGALGSRIGTEILSRFSVPIEAAQKTEKNAHIAILNAATHRGEFLAPTSSEYAADCRKLTWDLEARAKNRMEVSKRYHSDVADAVIYAFRHAQAYMEDPAPETLSFDQIEEKWLAEQSTLEERQQSNEWADFEEMGY
jgi:hypothetical protein